MRNCIDHEVAREPRDSNKDGMRRKETSYTLPNFLRNRPPSSRRDPKAKREAVLATPEPRSAEWQAPRDKIEADREKRLKAQFGSAMVACRLKRRCGSRINAIRTCGCLTYP